MMQWEKVEVNKKIATECNKVAKEIYKEAKKCKRYYGEAGLDLLIKWLQDHYIGGNK